MKTQVRKKRLKWSDGCISESRSAIRVWGRLARGDCCFHGSLPREGADINGCPEVGTPSAPRRYWKLPYLPFLVGYKSSQVNSPNFHDYILVDVHIHINSHSNSAKKVINRFVIPPYNKGMTTMWANICSTYMCDGSILHSSHFSFWTTFEVHCMNGI